ncbi:MAG: acylneuraminate cytidylyltransferase [Segetibacter sp.]|nr:acylneuraminate cytidylyltransferase [Segetibacter sp.]
MLSTDCQTIAATALNTAVEVPFIRPTYLASDTTPTYEVIENVITYYDFIEEHYDNIILLQPTCPFRAEGLVDACIMRFLSTGGDSLCTVREVPHEYNPHWVFQTNENGFMKIATGDEAIITSRQLLPKAYARDGSVYIFKADNFRQKKSMYGKNIAQYVCENQWHVNIDSHKDWMKAEAIANVLASMN